MPLFSDATSQRNEYANGSLERYDGDAEARLLPAKTQRFIEFLREQLNEE